MAMRHLSKETSLKYSFNTGIWTKIYSFEVQCSSHRIKLTDQINLSTEWDWKGQCFTELGIYSRQAVAN